MTQWNHDMSAAPRDGTRILTLDQKGRVGLSCWLPPRFTATGRVLEGDRWSAYPRGYELKAWMPLPDYPSAVPLHRDPAAIATVPFLDDVGSGA